MKVNEVAKTEDEALYEALDADNNTGVSTDTLVNIVKADRANEWTRYNSVSEYFAHLDRLEADAHATK